jgi:hypothetical protein
MRWFFTLLAWFLSSVVLAPVCFFATIFLAGPHSSVLPTFLQPLALLAGLAVVLAVPIWIARAVWRRMTRRLPRGAA